MASFFPASETVFAARDGTSAGDLIIKLDNARLEAGHGHDDLERGARWVNALDGPVVKWMGRIVCESDPVLGRDAPREEVRVVVRMARKREDFPCIRIHGDHGARAVAEPFFGRLLHI